MITPQNWTERLALHSMRQSHRQWRWIATGVPLLMMFVQLSAFRVAREEWRLWAAFSFAVMALWSLDRMVLYGILQRLEAEQKAPARGGASIAQSAGS